MAMPKSFYPLIAVGAGLLLALPWIGGFSLLQNYHGLLQAMPAHHFILQDRHNNLVSLTHLSDKPVFLSFGFRHCANTCPAQRATMLQVAEQLDKQAHFVWISLTPQSDKTTASGDFAPLLELFPESRDAALRLAVQYKQQASVAEGANPNHSDYIYLIDTSSIVRLLYQGSKVAASDVVADFHQLLL